MADDADRFAAGNLVPTVILPFFILVLFASFRLHTRINSTGIYYRFFPFHLKKKALLWDDVATATVRKYSPLGEYGGWGVRYGFKSGTAYNVSGNTGLQLVLKNGKKILIGTLKPEELQTVLVGLGK
jgi:hypothetical protein